MSENHTNNNGVLYTPPIQNQPAAQQTQPPQTAYIPSLYLPVKKTYKPFEKKDTAFVFLSLFAAFLIVDFALFHGFNIGFTIAYFVLFAVSNVYLWKKETKKSLFSLACGAISLAGAVTFGLFDNLLINAIMFVLIMGLYAFYVLGISDTFKRKQGSFKVIIDLFSSVFIDTVGGLENVIGSAKATSKKNKKFINSLIGIAIAIPFLVVIIPLLIQSDAAFEGLVDKIIKNIGIYLLELAIAVVATPFLFSYLFNRKNAGNIAEPSGKSARVFIPTISISFLSVISVTYIVYLFSQLAYFFSAFKGILPEDYHYTASVFARRGFYEMFAVCVINVAIISAVGILTKREKGRLSPVIKALSCFISLFSVLLVVIAMQKMRLNISIYGLSVNRVLVCTLMIMLLLMIAFFILHIFAPKISYMQPIIIICSALFVALSFANIDALCADYNIRAYQSGKIEMLDTVAIRKSSDSAIPYLIELAKSDDEVISNSAKNQLVMYVENKSDLSFVKGNKVAVNNKNKAYDFRRYNKARIEAYNGVVDYLNNLDDKEKKPVDKMISMWNNYEYYNDGDYFEDYSNDNYTLIYHYNPKTGNYDKVKKQNW